MAFIMRKLLIVFLVNILPFFIYCQSNFTTIQGAIDNANSGDTINIPTGIYTESLTINNSIHLIASSDVTLDVSGHTTGISISQNTHDVTISGLTIIGDELTGQGITINPGAQNINIIGNTINDVLSKLPGSKINFDFPVFSPFASKSMPSERNVPPGSPSFQFFEKYTNRIKVLSLALWICVF